MSGSQGATDVMTSIVIVNWNTCGHLAKCLASIQEAVAGPQLEVIVVDNASADSSVAMVRQQFPLVRVIANALNRGFSGGVNDGLNAARGEYILILNPDIVLHKGVIEPLARYLAGNPGVGAVVPSLRNLDGSEQTGYFRRLPTLTQVLLFSTVIAPWSSRRRGLVERYLEAKREPIGAALEVEQIPGAFLYTSRTILARVGKFDEAFRLFFEDVEWCARARELGMKLVMLPDLEVTHVGGRSFALDDGAWIQARYFVSLVTYFSHRRQECKAAVAALVVSMNALLVIVKNSVLRGWSNAEARKRATLSRRTHWNIIRLFFRAFVLRRDERPLP